MSTTTSPSEQITAAVTSWPGVEAGPGSRGEFAFTVGRKQIGHLHGDRTLHTSFPRALWSELHDAGRIDYHPVFPGKPGHASRRIDSESDVQDVIALLRMNYDRVTGVRFERVFEGLWASPPQTLPFGRDLAARAFLLKRPAGNLLVYSVDGLGGRLAPALTVAGGADRQYLNHGHEAMFAGEPPAVPLFVHAADAAAVTGRSVRATFTRRHRLDEDFEIIPTPGHTPGATAYLWTSPGGHRVLFTGDSISLDGDRWATAVLDSSDRVAYAESLALLAQLDFDVLVPWATVGAELHAVVEPEDARRRLAALRERLR